MTKVGTLIRQGLLAAVVGGCVCLGLALTNAVPVHAGTAPNGKTFMVYYRAWRDKTMKGVNTTLPDPNRQSMLDLPEGIDIVNVFSYVPSGEEAAAAPFYDALKTVYAPALHRRGVKLVRALAYDGMLADFKRYAATLGGPAPLTAAQQLAAADAWAQQEIAQLAGQYGLDGLDIDMEQHPDAATAALSDVLIQALAKYLGPKAHNGTLLIYDTNASDMMPFKNVAGNFSYVGYQQYGSGTDRTAKAAADYVAAGLAPGRFLAGLTFPEEGDENNRWEDTNPADFLASHTHQQAAFQATHNLGGMFLYAVDRDGRTYSETDLGHVMPTSYRWTKTAIAETKGYTLAQVKQAGRQHLARVAAHKGWAAATVRKTQAALDAADTVFAVYSAFMSDDYARSLDPSFDAVKELAHPLADKTALSAALATAKAQRQPQAGLTAAITAAAAVLADDWADQAAVDAATARLTAATAASQATQPATESPAKARTAPTGHAPLTSRQPTPARYPKRRQPVRVSHAKHLPQTGETRSPLAAMGAAVIALVAGLGVMRCRPQD
ncbi:EndoS/ChiA family endoglycosidase [Lacticaseibacillus daqingensis]|uniref:EndoS/ChiA family endoglycosidase n=1 Tax=Lacticaseibacillus daqingensis TaxID=2486014 RepID=UPI000F797C4B|nr:LPXTG cell wall anchor domain-containing protein [Lacticaseibacillus daqingensis]